MKWFIFSWTIDFLMNYYDFVKWMSCYICLSHGNAAIGFWYFSRQQQCWEWVIWNAYITGYRHDFLPHIYTFWPYNTDLNQGQSFISVFQLRASKRLRIASVWVKKIKMELRKELFFSLRWLQAVSLAQLWSTVWSSTSGRTSLPAMFLLSSCP